MKQPSASLARLLRDLTGRHDLWSVWSDFVEMAAIAISNAVDWAQRDGREARYLRIAEKYDATERTRFCEAFASLVTTFEETGHDDILGRTFMELELGSKWAGQFFTPFHLCRLMAELHVDDTMRATIAERGYVTASDPAVGAGAMPIALAAAMHAAGINYQQHLHVTAQDIDERAAHMCYVQLSMFGVPAIVVVGDTLRMEERARWYTPLHITGGWRWKLQRAAEPPAPATGEPKTDPVAAPDAPQLSLFEVP